MMKMPRVLRAFFLVMSIAASGCGGGGGSTPPTAPTPPTTTTPPATLTAAQQNAVAARMTSEAVDSLVESLTATGILTVTVSQSPTNSTMVVLINSFNDSPAPIPCTPSGQIRFQVRYSGAVRTDDGSDHLEASGTMTYDNCVLNNVEGGPITLNGTVNILALLGRQPSGRETMRVSGQINWVGPNNATGGCQPDWTTVHVLPDLRRFTNLIGRMCGPPDLRMDLQYVTTYLQNRRAANTNNPPGLLPIAGGPANAVGNWAGTIRATNPCSVGSPMGTYNWTGTLARNGDTFTFTWRDSYFAAPMVRNFPTNQTFTFTIADNFDTFTLTGRFATDYRSLTGDLTGRIDCVTSVRNTSGTWTGSRTGP